MMSLLEELKTKKNALKNVTTAITPPPSAAKNEG